MQTQRNSPITSIAVGVCEKPTEFSSLRNPHSNPFNPMSRVKLSQKNIIGPILNKIRTSKGISQGELAELCKKNGWSIARDTITRIESKKRLVADYEIFLLANALQVAPTSLLPVQVNLPTIS